jgi:alkaline phosphatase D
MADAFVQMVPNLKYAETSHRGYLIVTLTPAAATGDFVFVSSVLENSFSTFASPTLRVLPGSANRTLVPG